MAYSRNQLEQAAVLAVQQKNFQEAIECFAEVAKNEPSDPRAHHNLALAFASARELTKAEHALRTALALDPEAAETRFALSRVLEASGDTGAAVHELEMLWAQAPTLAGAAARLGFLYQQRGNHDDARRCYERALELQPDDYESLNNLATLERGAGDMEAAKALLMRALRVRPDLPELYVNLGNVLAELDDNDGAIDQYEIALRKDPAAVRGWTSLGNAHLDSGRYEDARRAYSRAIEVEPQSAEAHMFRSLVTMQLGELPAGFEEYEWRFRTEPFSIYRYEEPLWDGSSLAGKTILIHAEQGFGDAFQFIRYARELKALGARVVAEVHQALVPLLSLADGPDLVVGRGVRPVPIDVRASFMSLPRLLKTTLETIPKKVPYLAAEKDLCEQWRSVLTKLGGKLRVGIAWRGNPDYKADRHRSIALREFSALWSVPNVTFVCLQKDPTPEELSFAPHLFVMPGKDPPNNAFMDTAAILSNIDLFITSDSAIAHLAGALGVPVWMALPRVADWRWLIERNDSPWYPTMRLFRQEEAGRWGPVFLRIAEDLRRLARGAV